MNRYCDEFAFRYENRKLSDGKRATMLVAGAEGQRQLRLCKISLGFVNARLTLPDYPITRSCVATGCG